MSDIILASSSPRRKELMNLLGMKFEIATKEVEEHIDENLKPEENVKELALKKARAVALDYENNLIIGCDTVVALENIIMGKPKDRQDAMSTLRYLSGKEHCVYTGVAIICKEKNIENTFYEMTRVKMKALTDEEINDYVDTNEPLDKAGSYGIQGRGAIYIEGIAGDYYNVMGLPLCRLYKELVKLDIRKNTKR
jgi:septum formation protein